MGTAVYLIPDESDTAETLSSPGDSTASAVSDVSSYGYVRVVGASTGMCDLEIEKGLTESGPFFHYETISLDDEDVDRWIKLKVGLYPHFRLTATNTESSDAVQVKFFVYYDDTYKFCSPLDIRDLTQLSYTEVSDSEIMKLIDVAVPQFNSDICEDIKGQEIWSIDTRRPNTIDGSNTEFYVNLGSKYYFGDLDDDGEVDEDDITVYEYTDDHQKVLMTVSSLTTSGVDKGKFELSTAPAENSTITVTYRKQPVHHDNELVKVACANLTSALVMSSIDPNDFSSLKIGGLKAVMGVGKKKAKTFIGKYEALVNKIDYLRAETIKQKNDFVTIDFEHIDEV